MKSEICVYFFFFFGRLTQFSSRKKLAPYVFYADRGVREDKSTPERLAKSVLALSSAFSMQHCD
jgi:hypothetical protein